ncbi:glutamate 5-kinase [Batrachochytrium salamandrivorans]|nr:glutamate 5-kinase [Batrachochytrium salamandrivorans]
MEAILAAKQRMEYLEERVKELEAALASASVAGTPTPPPASAPGLRIVIKVGTSSLVDIDEGIKLGHVAAIVETVAKLRRANHQVLLVSSGAVGTGAHELGIKTRPKAIAMKQALAAVGQVRLMRELNSMLATSGISSAQILLTYGNLIERTQYGNAKDTIQELFRLGVVPIVNENDSVATEELRFGDNDRLSAMVACLVNADMLILLTDVNGVYTANPNVDPTARRIEEIQDVVQHRKEISTGGTSEFSTGGMDSKLEAAQIATKSGVRTVVMLSTDVRKVVEDNGLVPTAAAPHPITGTRRWIHSLPTRGKVLVDAGAAKAMKEYSNLFAAGVKQVEGNFHALDPVAICSLETGLVLGTGLTNISALDLKSILHKTKQEAVAILGSELALLPVVDRHYLVLV